MRPILLTTLAAVAATSLTAHAQGRTAIDQGSVLVGGSASITRTSVEAGTTELTSTNVFLSPRALFFIAPRFALGGAFTVGRTSSDNQSSTGLGAGPALRYYLVPGGRTALPYVGAGFQVSRLTYDLPSGLETSETTREFDGVVGVDFMVTRQVGIVAEAFVSSFRRNRSDSDATTFGLRFGIDAFFLR